MLNAGQDKISCDISGFSHSDETQIPAASLRSVFPRSLCVFIPAIFANRQIARDALTTSKQFHDPLRRTLLNTWITAFVFYAAQATSAQSVTVTLVWDPNPEPDIAGYKLHYGVAPGPYTQEIDVGNLTTHPVSDLQEGTLYVFAVKAYNTAGVESPFSTQVFYPPGITALPPSVTFTAVAGGATPPPQSILVGTSNGASWNGFDTSPWFNGGPSSGASGTPMVLVPNIQGLDPGIYSQSILFSAAGLPDKTVIVNLILTAPSSPTPTATPAPTSTPIPTPSATSAPTSTPVPTPSATSAPTSTPVHSPTATPAPTSPPVHTPTPTPANPDGLANVSTRLFVQTGDNAMIGGFIIAGSAPKNVILRAIGPSLTASGVSGAMPDPTLHLYDSSGAIIASNDNWRSNQSQIIQATGLAPSDDHEAAIVTSLPPAAYTAVVNDQANNPGVALFELYDLDPASSRLVNLSTRGKVETDDRVMVGGFIISGGRPTRIIVRAIGSSLSQLGIPNALLDPTLELHNGDGSLIAQNDNWRSDQEQEIIDSALAPSDDRESAIIATLNPGPYTAIVRGAGNSTGLALFEIYRLTP